jgi:hypothetical protein
MSEKHRCENCFYFVRANESGGECRKNPPKMQVLPRAPMAGMQPQLSVERVPVFVPNDYWCGEYHIDLMKASE